MGAGRRGPLREEPPSELLEDDRRDDDRLGDGRVRREDAWLRMLPAELRLPRAEEREAGGWRGPLPSASASSKPSEE